MLLVQGVKHLLLTWPAMCVGELLSPSWILTTRGEPHDPRWYMHMYRAQLWRRLHGGIDKTH